MQSNNTILTRDGTRIWINCHIPETDNKKLIIIAPGYGLTHDFYHLFASFFRQHGYTIISFDYRGTGFSAPEQMKRYKANLHDWAVQDINAVILYARYHFQKYEIIFIGHCIGGEIIGLAPASQYINKMVLISTSLTCEKLWPWYHRIFLRINKIQLRVISFIYGYLPGSTKNKRIKLPKGVAGQMANWCDSPNGLFDAYPDNNYRKINAPVLVYTFTDDWLCPPRAVKELLNHFVNASITWHHIKPGEIGFKKVGHTDFFYVSMKSGLWQSLLHWLAGDEIKQTA